MKVWGNDPVWRSKRLTNQGVSEKVLITKANSDMSGIRLPKAYNDAVNSPEGRLWKEAMYYELTKLEEMNTWSEVNESNISFGVQILPGLWVHLVKNLESGDKKFHST